MASVSAGFGSYISRYRLRRWAVFPAIMLLGGAPFIVFFVRVVMHRSPLGTSLRLWLAFCAGVVLLGVAVRLLHWRSERRLREALKQHQFRVCTHCGYTLNLEHHGRPCPECGAAVDLEACEREWRRFLRWGPGPDRHYPRPWPLRGLRSLRTLRVLLQ